MSGEKRNADGTLTVQGRAEGPDGMIGDGMITIGPDDPRYAVWDRYLAALEQPGGPPPGGTITAQLAGPATITEQVIILSRWEGWRAEPRDSHGKWTRVPGAADIARLWDTDGNRVSYRGSLGIDRKDMPQLSGTLADGRYAPSSEEIPKFIRYLNDRGVNVSSGRADARSLLPTQTQGDTAAIRRIADQLKSGEMRDTKPVFVSSDDRVLDGHHNWAGRALADSEGGRGDLDGGMPVQRADIPMSQLLGHANAFGEQEGLKKRAVGESGGSPALQHPDTTTKKIPADSLEKYTRPDGSLDPEREALHQQIISGILAGHQPQDHPVATFLGGGPASGKSTVLGEDAGLNSAVIDSDAVKSKLPEYRQMIADGDPRAASYAHEESSLISKKAMRAAQGRRLNYTLDGTGDSDIGKMTGKVSDAKRHGYSTEARYVTVDTDTAVKRAMDRAAKTGRMVPESVIRAVHSSVSDTYDKAARSGLFDKSELWDTSGARPALVAHKDPGGDHVIDDPAAYQRFLAKRNKGAA